MLFLDFFHLRNYILGLHKKNQHNFYQHHRLTFVSSSQPADVLLKVPMATYATPCLVSACVCKGLWDSSVTAVPLVRGFHSVQVTTLSHRMRLGIETMACHN